MTTVWESMRVPKQHRVVGRCLTGQCACSTICCIAATSAASRSPAQRDNNMSKTPKSSDASAAAGPQIETIYAEYTKAVASGIEGFAALRRQAFDVAAQQQREGINAWKKGLEIAVEGLKRSAVAQTDLIEVAAERGRTAAKLATENAESVAKTVAGVAAVFDTLAGYATTAQKEAVDFTAAQNTAAYDAAKQQIEASGSAATETFRRGVDSFLEAQRTVLSASAGAA